MKKPTRARVAPLRLAMTWPLRWGGGVLNCCFDKKIVRDILRGILHGSNKYLYIYMKKSVSR